MFFSFLYCNSHAVVKNNLRYENSLDSLAISIRIYTSETKQEAQLTLINPRDAFGDQSRSPNIAPFHMLGIVSSCAILTLFKTRRFYDIQIQKML